MPAMQASTLIAFSLVALVAIVTPGPTVLLALSNGTRLGLKRSLPGMLGAVLSDFVLIGAAAMGLGALLAASEFWFTVVKWVGAAYLAWLGLRLLRSRQFLFQRGHHPQFHLPLDSLEKLIAVRQQVLLHPQRVPGINQVVVPLLREVDRKSVV